MAREVGVCNFYSNEEQVFQIKPNAMTLPKVLLFRSERLLNTCCLESANLCKLYPRRSSHRETKKQRKPRIHCANSVLLDI